MVDAFELKHICHLMFSVLWFVLRTYFLSIEPFIFVNLLLTCCTFSDSPIPNILNIIRSNLTMSSHNLSAGTLSFIINIHISHNPNHNFHLVALMMSPW